MTTTTKSLLVVLLLSAWPLMSDAADAPPALSKNPFSRPSSEAVLDVRVARGQEEDESPALELQATMIGSVSRLANVGGRILKRGDEVQGHVLVAIHEQYAVFRKNGRNTTVYVKPLAEDDE